MTTQAMTVFGIDLGTTYSCIAHVDETGRPVVVPNAEGDQTTPSVVFFDGANRVVGKEAKNVAVSHPDQVVAVVKRQMGVPEWRFFYGTDTYTAEEISSYILRKVVGDATEYLGGNEVKDVVITCPAYFGVTEREATRRAGEIAGLNVLSIINEPTAAAIAFGLHQDQDQVVLVYDLGGGTFDITMIEIKSGAFTVIATGGNHHLGGRQWDEELVKYLARCWMEETGSAEDPMDSLETLQDLYLRAEAGKLSLTARESTDISVAHNGQRASVKVAREKFDELTAGLLAQTIQHTRLMLEQARTKGYDRFDKILLVGGATKMPQVKEAIRRELGVEAQSFEPDLAVAKGAAIYGFKLALDEQIAIRLGEITGQTADNSLREQVAPDVLERARQEVARDAGLALPAAQTFDRLRIRNVTSRSFGVLALKEESGRMVEVVSNLIRVNDALPTNASERFGTVEAGQSLADIHYVENLSAESEVDPTRCEEIGTALLHLPPGLPKGSPVEISFVLDEQGLLHATAREVTAGRTVEVDIKTDRAISADELEEAKARSTRLVVS